MNVVRIAHKILYIFLLLAIAACTPPPSACVPCFEKKILLTHLNSDGVQIIQVGDQVTFILATNLFFIPGTPTMKTKAYPALNRIVSLINQQNNYAVKVVGYVNNGEQPERDLALSRQQALAIADYLWRQGVNTPEVYSTGNKDKRFVTSNKNPEKKRSNQRIEISVQFLHEEDLE